MCHRSVWISLLVIIGTFFSALGAAYGQANSSVEYSAARLYQQGKILEASKKYAEAASAYSRSLELASDAEVYLDRGRMWEALGQHDKAVADFDSAIKVDPKFAWAYALRGTCRMEAQDYNHALSDFTVAIDLDPNDMRAFMLRAFVWLQLEKYDLALPDLNHVIRLQPDIDQVYKMRAMCWLRAEDWHRAVADFSQSIKLNPKQSDDHTLRGKAYEELKDFAAAKSDYELALSIEPKKQDATNALALLLVTCPDKEMRDYPRGISLAVNCCEWTNWKEFAHLAMLATAHAQAGQFAEAVKWQSQAIQLAPKDRGMELQTRLKLYQSGKSYYP